MKKYKIVLGAAFLPLAVLVYWGWVTVRGGFSARDRPSAVEAFVARNARAMAVPSSDRNRKNPYAATPENLRAGLEHFADHCAVCHANNGSGDTLFGRNMYPKPPDLRGARSQRMSDGEIFYIIRNGVRLSGMPAFGEGQGADDADTWKLVLFIRHLPALTPAQEKEMEQYNPKSAEEREEEKQEQEFLRGENPRGKTRHPHH